ncbi:hypothetical protein V6N12_049209 [Hibiscus sabdariffa]|uniref:Uncharacterized protein n=1 Tax=Hibiscus sabdariffa TaxID=183260 RepID=A0ABR2EJX0_9ROSI
MENTTHRSPPQQPEQPNDDGMETSECNGSSLGGRGRLEVEADEVKEEGIRGESEEGQEELLKDWIDCSAFDDALVPCGIMSARAALVEQGTTPNSVAFITENSC